MIEIFMTIFVYNMATLIGSFIVWAWMLDKNDELENELALIIATLHGLFTFVAFVVVVILSLDSLI